MKIKFSHVILALATGLLSPLTSNASTFGTTSTYSNIRWAFSTTVTGLSKCNDLALDGSGDMVNSSSFVVSGALNCPALGGAYGAVGSLYMGTTGTFNLNMLVGSGTAIQCVNMVGLSGTCSIINSAGVQLGSGFLNFRP